MNCWEFMKCEELTCPAYVRNEGKNCWKITGTRCGKGAIVKATKQEKIAYCGKCGYYKKYANHF